jgi:DNA polymerase-3 subunit epsilon
MRQIVLDTETTGLEPAQGHRIIEIGCVELVNRRRTENRFHCYLQPHREIDGGAIEVHGITREFLAGKPHFADIAYDFLEFVRGAELIIHNAAFDVGFIDYELTLLGETWGELGDHCRVTDTLALARRLHPGQRNSLDALCKRYGIDTSQRQLHGALLDAEILADVYLAMTGGQTSLLLHSEDLGSGSTAMEVRRVDSSRPPLKIVRATAEECAAHEARLAAIDENSAGHCVWLRATPPSHGGRG